MNPLLPPTLVLALATALSGVAEPLRLHPENPHYFLYQGKPAILITSGEHYGALLNLDFDFIPYFQELQKHGLNNTRVFSGAYVEPQGSFNIARNTLAPAKNRYIAPWARSEPPGYPNGGNKFDLTRWNPEYFERLHDLMSEADRHGVIVEMTLFCPFYNDEQWNLSPQNAANNVNNIGDVNRTNVYTLDRHGGLLKVHEAMTRKLVTELNAFDNLYFEVCNEPYFGGVTLEWQHRIAEVITETERNLPRKHLISRNVANGSAKVEDPHPGFSIFNFHYAWPPDAVRVNYELRKAIGDNETGFNGTNNFHYRREAWAFMLAGGSLYNNLDYSFTAEHEKGTFRYPASQPGGGNRLLREQLGHLKAFMHGFDFIRMKPARDLVARGLPRETRAFALGQAGRAYAVYLCTTAKEGNEERTAICELALPSGKYKLEWLDPLNGKIIKREEITSDGRGKTESPTFREDIALAIRRE